MARSNDPELELISKKAFEATKFPTNRDLFGPRMPLIRFEWKDVGIDGV